MTKLTLAQIIGEILAAENFKVGKVGDELKKYIDDYTEIEVNLLKDLLKDKKKYPNELDPRTGGNKFGYRGMTFKKDFIEKLKEVKTSNGVTEYEVPSNMKITSRSTKGYLSFTVDEEVAQGFGHYSGYVDHKKSPDRVGGYVRVSLDNPNFILHPDYTGELSKDLEYSKELEKETLLIGTSFKPDRIYVVDEEIYNENYADGKINEQEMSLDDFNTVGNVLRDSTKAKQIHLLLLQMFPQQKELLNYNYKNDSYAEFKRFIFHIDKYKLEGPVSINHTDLKLDPENMKDRERKYQEYIDGKIDKYFRDTNSDPRKVDLSKMPPITVDQNGFVTDGNHRAFLAIKQQKPLKGYKIVNTNNTHPNVAKILQIVGREVKENYADGKVKGKSRPGRVKKSGASCKGSVTDLRAKAKKYGGEKGKMYHWCANMKGGKK